MARDRDTFRRTESRSRFKPAARVVGSVREKCQGLSISDTRNSVGLSKAMQLVPSTRHKVWCERQSEMKCCSFPRAGRCPHTSSVRLNNRTTDRQPHAAAFWFRGKECLENVICFVGGQSDTCIADRDLDLDVLRKLRFDRKYSACVLHRLDSIEHKVH